MRTWIVVLSVVSVSLAGCSGGSGTDEEETSPLAGSTFSWSPAFPLSGETVTFESTPHTAIEGDELLQVRWRIENRTLDGQTAEHAFTASGDHVVKMQVRSDQGGLFTTQDVVTVLPAGDAFDDGAPDEDDPEPLTVLVRQDGAEASFAYTWGREADQVFWDFGDGNTSAEPRPVHVYGSTGTHDVLLRAAQGDVIREARTTVTIDGNLTGPAPPLAGAVPHVIVGVPDSGFNVYHEVYRRPDLTMHPCTYILDYPCGIPALELTLDADSWQEAFDADREIWESIRPGDRYWIPGTNIIGAICDQPYQGSNIGSTDPTGGVDHCILDDTSMHGTGTSSSVLSENPDALLIVVEGNSGGADHLLDDTFPVDIVSYSWGAAVPIPVLLWKGFERTPLVVAASGNEGAFPVVLDGRKANPNVFNIGAADAGGRSEPGYSGWKTMDFVSEYCRPTADTRVLSGMREQYCGTSFSAPTFAGALSRIILELRRESGYLGSVDGDMVDPLLGVTRWDIREALNHTATYEPEDKWNDSDSVLRAPLVAPWYQWGWGYVDSTVVEDTLACLREDVCPERPVETVTYMEALWTYRQTMNV